MITDPSELRHNIVKVRLNVHERALLRAAAKKARMRPAEYLRKTIMEEAEKYRVQAVS